MDTLTALHYDLDIGLKSFDSQFMQNKYDDLHKQFQLPYMKPPQASSYWKVPDERYHLTSIALNPMEPLCAVASGSSSNNLFVYEIGSSAYREPILTHHQTISLPNIHSIKWVPPNTGLGAQGNVVVTGHKDGLVHMTLLPDTYSSDTPAEILKRFNHLRHLADVPTSMSTRIKQLKLVGENWSCCPVNCIATICAEHLFLWNPARSDIPVLKQKFRGVNCFDLCDLRDGIVAFGGRKGVSISDMRVKGSNGLSPPDGNNTPVSFVRWSPHNENFVAAVHNDDTIKIWDIRSSGPLAVYDGHLDAVTSVEWASESSSQLVSSSRDGTIRLWDIHTCRSRNSPDSQGQWARPNSWKDFQNRQSKDINIELLYETRPVISQNKQFVDMKLSDRGAFSIDSDGYFGYHEVENIPSSPNPSSDSSENDFLPPSP